MKWRAVWRNQNVSDILMLPLVPEDVEIACQVTNYCKIFGIGSPLPIPGKITTSPVIRAMKGQRCGSYRAMYSQNGNHPGQVLSSGYMGNVSRCPGLHLR
jgi:hypothetical protein